VGTGAGKGVGRAASTLLLTRAAALGMPVVPEVYMMTATSSALGATTGSGAASPLAWSSSKVTTVMPACLSASSAASMAAAAIGSGFCTGSTM
jgi:hypothetical protein